MLQATAIEITPGLIGVIVGASTWVFATLLFFYNLNRKVDDLIALQRKTLSVMARILDSEEVVNAIQARAGGVLHHRPIRPEPGSPVDV